MNGNQSSPELLRKFFETGKTKSYEFRKTQLLNLKQALLRHEDDLYQALFTDLNKSREESWVTEIGFIISEINHSLKNLRQWMKPEKVSTNLLNFPGRSFIYKEPLGVVLIISPWNYPLQLLITPMVGAIAAGNCIVLKPSEFAPATAAMIKKIVEEIFPPEYIIVAEGDGAVVVPELIRQFHFNHIFYTGSTLVGKKIYEMAASQLIPVTLELGGKSPCVVEADANIKVTAKRIALTKFSNAGQMCVAPDYLLVHHKIKDQLVKELILRLDEFYPQDQSGKFGKIINERQYQRLKKYLKEGRMIYGGKYDDASHFMGPTLIEDVAPDKMVMEDEIFGPILPIISFLNFEEARQLIQKHPDPLAFYVFTESREKEKQWLDAVAFGGGCVNNASWHLTNFNLPFGGRGNSGIGAYHGKFSFDVFSHQKAVMKTPTWFDPSIKYPPFEGKLNLFKKIIK